MTKSKINPAPFIAAVPAIDITRKGCHTAWLPVGTLKPSDDGPGLMIELHMALDADDVIYIRPEPREEEP